MKMTNSDHVGNRVRRYRDTNDLTGTVQRVIAKQDGTSHNLLVEVMWDDDTRTMESTADLELIYGPGLERQDIMTFYETV